MFAVAIAAMIAAASASASGPGTGGSGLTPPSTANVGLAASARFIGGKVGVVTPGNVTVTATQNGVTISASASTMLRSQLVIKGVAPSGAAGSTVQIDRL